MRTRRKFWYQIVSNRPEYNRAMTFLNFYGLFSHWLSSSFLHYSQFLKMITFFTALNLTWPFLVQYDLFKPISKNNVSKTFFYQVFGLFSYFPPLKKQFQIYEILSLGSKLKKPKGFFPPRVENNSCITFARLYERKNVKITVKIQVHGSILVEPHSDLGFWFW